MKFYDREKDLEYFKKYFLLEPNTINTILFVDGSKSLGKSTVIKKYIKKVEFLIRNEVLFYDVLNEIAKSTSLIEWYVINKLLRKLCSLQVFLNERSRRCTF